MNRGNQAGKKREGKSTRFIPPPPAVTRELIKRAALSISGLAEKDGCAGWVAVALVNGLWDMLTGDYKGGTAKRRKDKQLDVVATLMRAGLWRLFLCICGVGGGVDPQGSRMIKCLQLQSDILECTNTHTHTYKHPGLHGCPLKRVVVGCLQMDAYWAPGPCGGHKRQVKRNIRLDSTSLLLRLFYHQLSHTTSKEINSQVPQPGGE